MFSTRSRWFLVDHVERAPGMVGRMFGLDVHQQRVDICCLWCRITLSTSTVNRFHLPRRVEQVLDTSIAYDPQSRRLNPNRRSAQPALVLQLDR